MSLAIRLERGGIDHTNRDSAGVGSGEPIRPVGESTDSRDADQSALGILEVADD